MRQVYLDELTALLGQVRRRWTTARGTGAAARAFAAGALLLLVVLGADRFLAPADLPMAALAIVACLTAIVFAVWTFWPLRRPPTDRQIARYIEERCPELEDRLASAAAVSDTDRSSVFQELMLGDAATRARAVDLDRVMARRDVRHAVLRGVAATALFTVVLLSGSGSVGRIARTAWLYAFPYAATLEIAPGDARVVAGEPLRIRATLGDTYGAPARTAPTLTLTTPDGRTSAVEMQQQDDGVFELVLPSVEDSFEYVVRAATLRSDTFSVRALFAPRVEQVDVAYRYPASTGLPPRLEPDSGDVYAPAGTEVTVTVHVDKPIRQGGLVMGGGAALILDTTNPRALTTTFVVAADDAYRIALTDADGLRSAADVDYFIRTITDRPPTIEIVRPGGDRDITPLEEVVIEARADDDYGIERFELVHAVIGRDAVAIDFPTGGRPPAVSGRHTLYAEDLVVQPGDFISYYARARDTNTGPGADEVRSDIYFLQIRPFDQEFEDAPSQSSSGRDAGDVGNLAEVQKEIIVATWKLDREPPSRRPQLDMETVATAQAELRAAATRVAERVMARGRESTPENRGRRSPENEAMALAVEAMGVAETALRVGSTKDAIPPEMEALNELLKAQAEIRRRQVSLQQGDQGGESGANAAQEDLSALFDQELRREQQTNYEDRASEPSEQTQEESEALERLKELADRQEALSKAQRELADDEESLGTAELARALERLTREQNELREQIEELRKELQQSGQDGQVGSSGDQRMSEVGGQMSEVAEQMQRAMSELRRQDPSEAAERGQAALEALREMARQMAGDTAGDRRQALGELQLEAQQLAEAQRQVASETRQTAAGQGSRESRHRLAGREDRLADRVDALDDRLEDLVPEAGGQEREALQAARDELVGNRVADEMRRLADRMRAMGAPEAAGGTAPDDAARELGEIASSDEALAETLERVAERLREGGGSRTPEAERLARELEDAQELRRSLEELEQQLEQLANAGSGRPPDADASANADGSAASDQEAGGQIIQPGSDPQASPDGRPTGERSERGMAGGGELAELQREMMRQLAELPALLEHLGRQRPTIEQDLEQWAEHWQSGPSPGTEAFKQDFSAWESLRDDVELAIEALENDRSRGLYADETDERLKVGPNERMPEQYRALVEDYYRSLTSEPAPR